jgi:hypothetical protein
MILEDGYGSYNCIVIKQLGRGSGVTQFRQLHPIRVGGLLAQLVLVRTLWSGRIWDSGELRFEKR